MKHPIIIKGDNRDQWDNVQLIQHDPFVYISSNGSKWAGEAPDDISKLLEMLNTYRLIDYKEGNETINPCVSEVNPAWGYDNPDVPHWIDGERMYKSEVSRFTGNFENYSHCFCIDTNHAPTIEALRLAIKNNQSTKK